MFSPGSYGSDGTVGMEWTFIRALGFSQSLNVMCKV